MADITVDGMTRVGFVTAIANPQAMTVTEANAGILLHSLMTPTGLQGFEAATAAVNSTALDSTTDTEQPGRDSFKNLILEFKKQSGTDTPYASLTKGTVGFVVIRRDFTAATGWASTQPYEAYPVAFGQRKRLTPGINEVTKWQAQLFLTAAPALAGAIA